MFILGKKLDMTQVWEGDKVIPVTRVQAGPCVITQIKTADKDGYQAVQIGFGEKKEKNIKKPQKKQLSIKNYELQIKSGYLRHLREFKINTRMVTNLKTNDHELKNDNETGLKIGDIIDVSTFEVGDIVKVVGTSKGKGFQGVVKRHGFHGQDKTHGNKDQLRMPGSVGSAGPAHIFKGTRMPGRMGGNRRTVAGLRIIEIDKENNMLLIKGAIPGARNGLLSIVN